MHRKLTLVLRSILHIDCKNCKKWPSSRITHGASGEHAPRAISALEQMLKEGKPHYTELCWELTFYTRGPRFCFHFCQSLILTTSWSLSVLLSSFCKLGYQTLSINIINVEFQMRYCKGECFASCKLLKNICHGLNWYILVLIAHSSVWKMAVLQAKLRKCAFTRHCRACVLLQHREFGREPFRCLPS